MEYLQCVTTAYISSRPGPRGSETSWYRRASPRRLRGVLLRSMIVMWRFVCSPALSLPSRRRVRCDTGMVCSWRLGHTVAKFQQVDKSRSNVHHDALEFPDGKIVLLTNLC